MVDQVDKLMGRRDEAFVYASFRIDYSSEEDIRFDDDGTPRFDGLGSVKAPSPGHPDHPPKDGYDRKVLCENGRVKDAVVEFLESENIEHTVESVNVSSTERSAIEDNNAPHGVAAKEVLDSL